MFPEIIVTLVDVALLLLLVAARRRYAWFGPRLFMIALFGVMSVSGPVYVLLGGGPYLVPLLALLVVLVVGFALALLPRALVGSSRSAEGEDEAARSPATWGRAVRVMQYGVLAALFLTLFANRAAPLGIVSLAIGVANLVALAAYGVISWRQRGAVPWDRFGSWYYLAIVSCLVVGAGLLGVIRF